MELLESYRLLDDISYRSKNLVESLYATQPYSLGSLLKILRRFCCKAALSVSFSKDALLTPWLVSNLRFQSFLS